MHIQLNLETYLFQIYFLISAGNLDEWRNQFRYKQNVNNALEADNISKQTRKNPISIYLPQRTEIQTIFA